MESKQLTIAFIDAKSDIQNVIQPILDRFGGRLVKKMGHACLCSFPQTDHACQAALEIQATYQIPRSTESSAPSQELRIGITRGDVTATSSDIFGEAVNLAARLAATTEGGSIYFTEAVLRGMDPLAAKYREIGLRQFKGMDGTVRIFAFGEASPSQQADRSRSYPPPPPPPLSKPKPQSKADLFDFSRVEQERIQETEAMRNARASAPDLESVIPLVGENTESLRLAAPEVTKSKLIPVDLSIERNREKRRKAIRIFLVWSVGVPLALLSAGWGYFFLEKKIEQQTSNSGALDQQLKNSEVIQSLNTKRPRKYVAAEDAVETSYAKLFIETKPPGAEVSINGQALAKSTPLRVTQLPTRTNLRVQIRKLGYEESVQLLNLSPEEEKELSVTLVAK